MLEWVQYAQAPPLDVTWLRTDGTPENLTDATITGVVCRADGTVDALTGSLEVIDGAAGVFRWTPSADDVAETGRLVLQFTADYDTGATPAKTKRIPWIVHPSLVVPPAP